jgi:glyoxylase-like metal-dependent hydrolase (beta-lactamase superfamily II)
MIKLITFANNDIRELQSNTYLLIDETLNCVVIDPSSNNKNLLDYIERNNYKLKAVLLTHGHIDHIRGVNILFKKFKIDTYIHFEDEEMLYDSYLNCCDFLGEQFTFEGNVKTFVDNEVINVISSPIKIIHTPYHTKGSSCFFLEEEKMLFSGDSLFYKGVGRSDLPTGSYMMMKKSLEKIKRFLFCIFNIGLLFRSF